MQNVTSTNPFYARVVGYNVPLKEYSLEAYVATLGTLYTDNVSIRV